MICDYVSEIRLLGQSALNGDTPGDSEYVTNSLFRDVEKGAK